MHFRQSTRSQLPAYQYAYGDKTASGVCLQNIFDYSPFGVALDGRTMQGAGYRYGFNGMEKDDEVKGIGNSYDFGARMYDSRVGRWLSIDKLFSKRPNQSQYSFVANNPIINKEIDGNDYEVIVNKSDKGNTITIKATYYTDVKGSESNTAATKATQFWNDQNGKFKYLVNEIDGTITEYDVVFELDVKDVSESSKNAFGISEGSKNDAYDDKKGNSLIVKPDNEIQDQLFGTTTQGQFIEVAASRKDTDTPAHELGHTLNLGHFLTGLMKEIDKAGKITRESIVTEENVQQIIDYAFGRLAGHESTAPEGGKVKTTVSNPNNEKTEGKVKMVETVKK